MFSEKSHFYTFAKRTLNWLIRRQLNSHINFCIHMLQYVVLVEVYEENLTSHLCSWKRRTLQSPKVSWELSGVLKLHFENDYPLLKNTLGRDAKQCPSRTLKVHAVLSFAYFQVLDDFS